MSILFSITGFLVGGERIGVPGRGSGSRVGISGAVKKKRATSGFGLQVMLGGSLFDSVTCTLQLYCGNIPKIV